MAGIAGRGPDGSIIRFGYLSESEEIKDGLISVDARLLKGDAASDYGIVFRSAWNHEDMMPCSL